MYCNSGHVLACTHFSPENTPTNKSVETCR